MIGGGHWFAIKDGEPAARALFADHYSAGAHRRLTGAVGSERLFVGPGEKLVLLTADSLALWAWSKSNYRQDGQTGVNCAVFRNTSPVRSSDLIREAVDLAWSKWPGQRLFTFVDPSRVRSSNPGCCYQMAGWRRCGQTAKGLLIFELCPIDTREVGHGG